MATYLDTLLNRKADIESELQQLTAWAAQLSAELKEINRLLLGKPVKAKETGASVTRLREIFAEAPDTWLRTVDIAERAGVRPTAFSSNLTYLVGTGEVESRGHLREREYRGSPSLSLVHRRRGRARGSYSDGHRSVVRDLFADGEWKSIDEVVEAIETAMPDDSGSALTPLRDRVRVTLRGMAIEGELEAGGSFGARLYRRKSVSPNGRRRRTSRRTSRR